MKGKGCKKKASSKVRSYSMSKKKTSSKVKSYSMTKKKAFKPCRGCPTPAKCKRMGKCMGKK